MSIASTGDKVTAPADRHRALDGLRAVAVVYVLVFHFWTRLLPGGFVGVDLFFVLSGFLINSLLMEQIERRGRIDVLTFLKRRYLRLGVPLSLMVVSTLVAVAITSAHLLPATCVDSVWVLTYTSNWKRAYIELFGGSLFFSHTWSLGVEEWFYVGWPFLLVSLHRRTSCAADSAKALSERRS